MSDRPGRRARRSLLLSGLLLAVAAGGVGAASAGLGAGPPLPLTAAAAAGLLGLGVLGGWAPGLRRVSSGVLVVCAGIAAVAGAVVLGLLTLLLVLGRLPVASERALLAAAVVAVVVTATIAGPLGRRAARAARAALHGARRSPDELLADIAERAADDLGVDDVLRRLAESMRRDWRLSRVEIWASSGPGADPSALHRGLVVPQPLRPGTPPAPLAGEELAALRRVGVAGPGWLRLWLPRLLDGHARGGDRQLRLAPAVHAGRVLALVVIERAPDADAFTGADERALAEVARRLAIVLRNRVLDETLQVTLADLRRTNADLQASRMRLVAAADAERRRIERDLHDGAQQHLVALAVGLRLIRDELRGSPGADLVLLDELDRGVRESIAALRDLAHGIYPPLLRDGGLAEALRVAAGRSGALLVAEGIGRHPEEIEAAVYFCCLEALQNAAKHAPGAAVTLRLEEAPGELRFAVVDDGPGFAGPAGELPSGAGLQNMADRVGAIGGTVGWHSSPGAGTSVTGRVPVPAVPTALPEPPVVTSRAG